MTSNEGWELPEASELSVRSAAVRVYVAAMLLRNASLAVMGNDESGDRGALSPPGAQTALWLDGMYSALARMANRDESSVPLLDTSDSGNVSMGQLMDSTRQAEPFAWWAERADERMRQGAKLAAERAVDSAYCAYVVQLGNDTIPKA